MRVLHIHSGNLYGGVETVLTTLVRVGHACAGMSQHFALCFEGRLSRELSSMGVAPHPLGPARASRPWSVIRARNRLRTLISQEPFDALVFHSAWSHGLFGSIGRDAKIPSVLWVHGTTGGRHWSERLSQRTDPSLILCNSRFTAGRAAGLYPNVSTHVLYCPVELNSEPLPLSERIGLRRDLHTPGDAAVIVQVSRMERWKGQLLHLEALSRLRSIPNWIAWFVGGPQRPQEGQYFQQVRETAERLGIADRVRFLKERSDVPQLLRAADIYCQPNLGSEPFGITFVEALNAGLPVVTTSIGAATEIIDGTCGMLMPPDNAEDLSNGLRRLIENKQLRQQLGQSGPARAKALCDAAARINDLCTMLTGIVTATA